MIEKGIQKKGFSLIEAISPCPTAFGRQNKMGQPIDQMMWIKDRSIDIQRAKTMKSEELAGKFITGILADIEKPEYTELYEQIVERLKNDGKAMPELPARDVGTAIAGVGSESSQSLYGALAWER